MYSARSKVKFDKNGKPIKSSRVTVVGELQDGVLKVAVSKCHKGDTFQKSKGRMIAVNRLKANKLYLEQKMETCRNEDFYAVAQKVFTEVIEQRKHPVQLTDKL